MTRQPKLRITLLAAALAATATAAWAANGLRGYPAWVPDVTNERANPAAETVAASPIPPEVAMESKDPQAAEEPAIVAVQPGSPAIAQERVVAVEEKPLAATRTEALTQPAIEITKPRLTRDQRIQADVIDAIARAPHMTGQVGVVSENSVVTLSGWTLTSGQAQRAGRAARAVEGVREVQNGIRPRVGGMT